MEEKERKPKIRFKGFTEAWEQRKVNDLLELLTDYDANGSFADMANNVNTYDGSGYAWYVRMTDLENNEPLTKLKYVDKSSYDFMKKTHLFGGELLMAKRGEIGKVYIFQPRTRFATVAPNMYLLKLNKNVIPRFLHSFFISDYGNSKLQEINASTTMGAIYKDDVKNIELKIPNISEQEKIGDVFERIDNLITLHQRKYDKLVNVKKALLEKMFPKNDSNVPEIRFKGFTEAWEQRKLIDIVDFTRGRGLSWNDITDKGINECILYGHLYTDYGMVIKDVKYRTNVEKNTMVLSQFGDVLIPSSDTTPTGLARATSVDKTGVILGGDINVLRPKKDNGDFISYSINANKKELLKRIKGTTVRHLNNSDLEDVEIKIAPNVEEQKNISDTLTKLDNLITLHQRKLEKLKNIKKSLLEKMFV